MQGITQDTGKQTPSTPPTTLPIPRPKRRRRNVQSQEEFTSTPQPHTPDQELTHFGNWVGEPIWVPPKDNSVELAKSILNQFGTLSLKSFKASKEECWQAVIKEHRSKFTQVREFELPEASIRLPKGRLFVAITERKNFDKIEETIPDCVQTRLDEFLEGPGEKRGVKVYYLKPLCVESGSDLIFTTAQEINESIEQIQAEVFREYKRRYLPHLLRRLGVGLVDAALAIPRSFLKFAFKRKKQEIEAFHSKLEFERRRRAMEASRMHNKYRADKNCTFDEIESLTTCPQREEVIEHYVRENELGEIDREMFKIVSTVSLPWFATLSLSTYKLALVSLTETISVPLCDPAFVAEMPRAKGKLLKIGHFDEVDGVMHVEI